MAIIAVPLHSRKHPDLVAYVDEEDYDLVSQFRWNVQPGRNTFYAITFVRINGKSQTVRMHRLIASPRPGMFIDHIDGNGLNNSRENLREVTNRENLQQQKCRPGSSKFTGVYFDKNSSKNPWKAYIGIDPDGGPTYLGRFPTEEDAARAYDKALVELDTPSAFRNFPSNVENVEEALKEGFNK